MQQLSIPPRCNTFLPSDRQGASLVLNSFGPACRGSEYGEPLIWGRRAPHFKGASGCYFILCAEGALVGCCSVGRSIADSMAQLLLLVPPLYPPTMPVSVHGVWGLMFRRRDSCIYLAKRVRRHAIQYFGCDVGEEGCRRRG